MTREQILQRYPRASESFIRRNLDPVAGLQAQVPQPNKRGKKQDRQLEAGTGSVAVRIEITSYRRRLLDQHDNLPMSCKQIVDNIARSLGVPDNDPRITWRFYQIRTDGEEGCVVRINVTEK